MTNNFSSRRDVLVLAIVLGVAVFPPQSLDVCLASIIRRRGQQGQAALGVEHQLMRLVNVSIADGVDPELGELAGLLAEQAAGDDSVDGRGDEEGRAQHEAGQGRAASSQRRPAGGDAAEGQPERTTAASGASQSDEESTTTGESKPARSPATAKELSAVARDLFVGRVEDAGGMIGCGHQIGIQTHCLIGQVYGGAMNWGLTRIAWSWLPRM